HNRIKSTFWLLTLVFRYCPLCYELTKLIISKCENFKDIEMSEDGDTSILRNLLIYCNHNRDDTIMTAELLIDNGCNPNDIMWNCGLGERMFNFLTSKGYNKEIV